MASYTHGPGIDDPLIVRKSGNDYFYYKNHQGSVTELRDANGAGYKTYVYDAFGNMEETGPTFNRGFTYTARELHNRSGLYYYRARFYNPKLGRFITQDPIGYLGGVNLYAYAGNAPILFADPLGLCAKDVMDWLMNDFIVPGPYGNPDPNEWGNWVSLPYEAGKFGEDWENAEWAAIEIAAVADAGALGLIGLQGVNAVLMPGTLYHFTSFQGAAGIWASGAIQAGTGFALYGRGVYLTALNSPTIARLQGAAAEYYFSVVTQGLNISATYFPGTYIVRGGSVPLP